MVGTELSLRRAWPRSPKHLLLEYIDRDGGLIAGQWHEDQGELKRVARQTARAGTPSDEQSPDQANRIWLGSTSSDPDTYALLQAQGTDRRLPGLASLIARDVARLLVHRPERRAVVRLDVAGQIRYVKVVRPERVEALVATSRLVQALPCSLWSTPEVLTVDRTAGAVTFSALAGRSLDNLLDDERLSVAAHAVGAALADLHSTPQPRAIRAHHAEDEVKMLRGWIDRTSAFVPRLRHLLDAAGNVYAALNAGTSPPALLHRDFYDKQVFADAHNSIGILDFDTLAIGEAALDLANALVHFELRALQARCAPDQGRAATEALLAGYSPSPQVLHRLMAYADAARLRLACVYAFRPHWSALPALLVERLGQPVPSLFHEGRS